MQQTMTKIYKLNHYTTVCYVGKTTQDLKDRFAQHMRKKNLPHWEYSIELICEVDDDMAATIENLNINSYNTIIEGLNRISAKNSISENVKQHKYDEAMKRVKESIKKPH